MTNTALIGDSHSVTHFKFLQPYLEENGFNIAYYKPKSGWSARAFITRDDVNIRDMPQGITTAVIALGGNNAELDDQKYFARLDTFIARLKESGVKRIVWLGPMVTDATIDPNTAKRHDYTRDAQARYFANKPYVWIDMYPHSSEGHYDDGIHFRSSQYEHMIEQTRKQIKNGISLPIWLIKPRYYWIPLLMIAGISGMSYIGYKYYKGDESWRYPQIS